jgi:hypothetical protein
MRKLLSITTALAALAFGAPSASAQTLDLTKAQDVLTASRKLQCSLEDGKPTVFWWEGHAYSRVAGEKDRKLFNVEGMNVRTCLTVKDEKRGTGYRLVSREVLFYLDPNTNEVLRTWKNPWTGEEVEVVHVANDPVNGRPSFPIGADGKPMESRFKQKNGVAWTTGEAPLFYPNPLAGDYQDYAGGTYHAMEMINFFADEKELLDATSKEAMDVKISWGRISQWIPWMKMGDKQGIMIFHTGGMKLKNWDELPVVVKDEIKKNYAEYVAPPPTNDARPNETSWTYAKKKIDEARAKSGEKAPKKE